ncbi:MAG TPA: hypothetical protein VEX86_22805, partial [Longimicrobium sp.]|nr:hypothetical protein [Longimicrobium sp.]
MPVDRDRANDGSEALGGAAGHHPAASRLSLSRKEALRRLGCNPNARTFGAGSDDCGSARLVDEWLQARNALSIEIFCRTPTWGAHPVFRA